MKRRDTVYTIRYHLGQFTSVVHVEARSSESALEQVRRNLRNMSPDQHATVEIIETEDSTDDDNNG